MVVISQNPVHSVLWLIVTFFAISGHYILLNAQFLAIVNIIVYAGATWYCSVVIMLMNLNAETEPQKNKWLTIGRCGCRRLPVIGNCCCFDALKSKSGLVAAIAGYQNLGKIV